MYRDILENELPTLLENLRLEVLQNMLFQHDGCPEHYYSIGLPDCQILIRQISFCGAISKTKLTNKNQQSVRIWLSESEIQSKFKPTHFSVYIPHVLNSKIIALSTYFNWKMMKRGDSHKSSSLRAEKRGNLLNQAPWEARGLTLINYPEGNRRLLCPHRCSWLTLKVVYSSTIYISIGNNFQVIRNLQHE
mgnify:FL=1